MCSGPKQSKSLLTSSPSGLETATDTKDINMTIVAEDSFSSLLEHAANDDAKGFMWSIECDASSIDQVGLWYGRHVGSKQIVLEHRTPLMVAATYGSIDVINLILSRSDADKNFSCGPDKSTALHCAASGGSVNAVDVVKLLLSAGADPYCMDVNGRRPVDVIVVPPKLQSVRVTLEKLLTNNSSDGAVGVHNLRVAINTSNSDSPTLPSSPENGCPSFPMASKYVPVSSASEKKEYPVDPSFPDIKSSIYTTDMFRMYSFKIRPCSRAYSHDWTECPFVHLGENARRRDPRKFHYSCVPCPDFRKGACRRGDTCDYAHGVFECWLHPAQYRTRLCKDGTNCSRRVCFFAHTAEELRPLYVSTGSAVPSPRSSVSAASVMDMATALIQLPGSPSSVSAMSPSPFSQPMSPSANGMSNSSVALPQPNVPTLHLPGTNLQSSRLRSSLSACDIAQDFNMFLDFDGQQQLFNDLSCFSHPRYNSVSVSHSGQSKTPTPTNLENLFSAEITSSPRYSDQAAASDVFSLACKSAVLNQFQQQQSMLSPINTSVYSPKNVEHLLFQASFGAPSPGRMSPKCVEPISPMSSRVSAFALHEKQQQQLHSLSSRDLGSHHTASIVGSPVNSWLKWGSLNGKLDWSINGDELGKLQRSSSFNQGNSYEEPDLLWVQSLVKESTPEIMIEKLAAPVSGGRAATLGEG